MESRPPSALFNVAFLLLLHKRNSTLRPTCINTGAIGLVYGDDGGLLRPKGMPTTVRYPARTGALPPCFAYGRASYHGIESGGIVYVYLKQVHTGATSLCCSFSRFSTIFHPNSSEDGVQRVTRYLARVKSAAAFKSPFGFSPSHLWRVSRPHPRWPGGWPVEGGCCPRWAWRETRDAGVYDITPAF
jgi:hypothetical protein